jgi:hypothetical protein
MRYETKDIAVFATAAAALTIGVHLAVFLCKEAWQWSQETCAQENIKQERSTSRGETEDRGYGRGPEDITLRLKHQEIDWANFPF